MGRSLGGNLLRTKFGGRSSDIFLYLEWLTCYILGRLYSFSASKAYERPHRWCSIDIKFTRHINSDWKLPRVFQKIFSLSCSFYVYIQSVCLFDVCCVKSFFTNLSNFLQWLAFWVHTQKIVICLEYIL